MILTHFKLLMELVKLLGLEGQDFKEQFSKIISHKVLYLLITTFRNEFSCV